MALARTLRRLARALFVWEASSASALSSALRPCRSPPDPARAGPIRGKSPTSAGRLAVVLRLRRPARRAFPRRATGPHGPWPGIREPPARREFEDARPAADGH